MLPDLTEVQEIVRNHGTMHIKVADLLHRMVKNKQIKYYQITNNCDVFVRGIDYPDEYNNFDYCHISKEGSGWFVHYGTWQ